MKLNDILKELLVEGRLDFFRNNEKLIRDKWQALSEKDELSEKERAWCEKSVPISDDLLTKMSEASEKYLGWIIGVYKREFIDGKFNDTKLLNLDSFINIEKRFAEDLYKYKNTLDVFDSNDGAVSRKLPQKTIGLYADQKELYKALEEHGFIEGIPSLNEREVQQKTLAFIGNVFDVFVPTTKEESCVLGAKTNWCTAYPEDKHNRFEDYNHGGKLYILINRSNPNEKYQFYFENGEYTDKNDTDISELGYKSPAGFLLLKDKLLFMLMFFNKNMLFLCDIDLSAFDLSFLKHFKNLKDLSIINGNLNNLDFLIHIPNKSKIKNFDFKSNIIDNPTTIKQFKNLTRLYIHDNKISDFSLLYDLQKLEYASIYNNSISKKTNKEIEKKLTNIHFFQP